MSTITRLSRELLPLRTSAAPDRVPGELSQGTPPTLADALRALVGADQVLTSATDLVRYASDASPYRLIPQVVVVARDHRDVAAVLRYAAQHGHHVTFRAAGTSLNGQAQSDDILIDVRRFFAYAIPEDDGALLRCGPGMIVARANLQCARYGRKLGPDPASSGAATVGGVVANNASGMAAGVKLNSYNTLVSMRFVLPSGTVVDTADPDADAHLAAAEPDLVAGLVALRDEIRADEQVVARLRKKFAIKNTNGYRLDAFLDEDSPVQILRRLLVGSQGTLGFVDETVFRTVPIGKYVTTAMLHFPDLGTAAAAVPTLMGLGANTGELLDNPTLRATAPIPGAPEWMHHLVSDEDAAVLTDFRSDDPAAVQAFADAAMEKLGDSLLDGEFTTDAKTANGFWRVRSGVLPALGGVRPPGTTVLAEDVCVPPDRVAEAAVDIRNLLEEHNYPGSVQGHASAGNLHFVLVLDTGDAEAVARYATLMNELVDLIVDKYDGSLKGEHATGRNMAPFVEREWGAPIMAYFRRVKQLIDPKGLLNPGVLLNDDPQANVAHLKGIPALDPELDKCIECGFCEPVCPSREVTTTPRQRIVLQREMRRQGHTDVARELAAVYEYAAVDTCAGDSSCQVACPVDIDTGVAMKDLRYASHGMAEERLWAFLARHWGLASSGARTAIAAAGVARRFVGDRPLTALTNVARGVAGSDVVPRWIGTAPRPAKALPRTAPEGTAAVYFPACINRIFGVPRGAADDTSVVDAIVALAERAGTPVWIPDDVAGLCCSTPWHSKGYATGNEIMANRLAKALWRWTDGGARPVIVDASSCTLGMLHEMVPFLTEKNRRRHAQLRIVDALTWAREEVIPVVEARHKAASAVLHPTCSMAQLGLGDDLRAVAEAAAERVVVPTVATCCGFAGDRGFLHPELTESATRAEAEEVARLDAEVFLSGNRTCELGMEHATDEPYESALIALERATR